MLQHDEGGPVLMSGKERSFVFAAYFYPALLTARSYFVSRGSIYIKA